MPPQLDLNLLLHQRSGLGPSGVESILRQTVLHQQPRDPSPGPAMELNPNIPARSAGSNPADRDCRRRDAQGELTHLHVDLLTATQGWPTDAQPIRLSRNLHSAPLEAEIDKLSADLDRAAGQVHGNAAENPAVSALLGEVSTLTQQDLVYMPFESIKERHPGAFAPECSGLLQEVDPKLPNSRIRFSRFEIAADMTETEAAGRHFIVREICNDLEQGKVAQGGVVTRFPPEPNGYLHIGHAKSICLNFGLAQEFKGRCHLRFDDTNPTKEDPEFVEAIQDDVRWLGFDWGEHLYHASDYFPKLYELAVQLIRQGQAYVCDLTPEDVRAYRGTLTEPGRPSPNRDRSVEENLDLFERMKKGEFEDGSRTLRAKIDMASGNINLRDPTLYRIRKVPHHRTGDQWCIYPMYDWTHGISDALEEITHSICTLEFENHRPLYDWYLEQLNLSCHPRQIEFSRLNLYYTVMSKRKLTQLVQDNVVEGWDDPRMPTIAGLRRRGYTPESIREFCERIGVSKNEGWIQYKQLEDCIRSDLNTRSKRIMGVLDPLKIVIENYPEGQTEEMRAPYFPDDPPLMGDRALPFSREIYIERSDFMEDPPRKFFRLAPGREVRLRRAYYITCTDVIRDDQGKVVELRATYDPESKGGCSPDGRRVKGTLHWVSAQHALEADVYLYDRLFTEERPDAHKEKDWMELLNPDSLKIVKARLEPSAAELEPETRVQFERLGFFVVDKESQPGAVRFNRIVTLRDTWAKMMAKGGR